MACDNELRHGNLQTFWGGCHPHVPVTDVVDPVCARMTVSDDFQLKISFNQSALLTWPSWHGQVSIDVHRLCSISQWTFSAFTYYIQDIFAVIVYFVDDWPCLHWLDMVVLKKGFLSSMWWDRVAFSLWPRATTGGSSKAQRSPLSTATFFSRCLSVLKFYCLCCALG